MNGMEELERAAIEAGIELREPTKGPDPRDIERVQEMIREAKKRDPKAFAEPAEVLIGRRASAWLKIGAEDGPPDLLFGPFWQSGELALMFGATGSGKSVLGVQIAETLARGERMAPFNRPGLPPLKPQRVLYIDFELSNRQFVMRYSAGDGSDLDTAPYYEFSRDLFRAVNDWNGQILEGYDSFAEMFYSNVSDFMWELETTVLVVDNITILDQSSTSNASIALNIMRSLHSLKRQHHISILVLAHTTKRQTRMPITYEDLQGSVNLANFADSIFAVGRSRSTPEHRYLKQIKVRTGRPVYIEHHVPVFALEKYDLAAAQGRPKPDGETANFLGFKFVDFAHEEEHLSTAFGDTGKTSRPAKRKRPIIRRARRLAAEGRSTAEIAAELGIPRSTAHRYAANG